MLAEITDLTCRVKEKKSIWKTWLLIIIACIPAAVLGLLFDEDAIMSNNIFTHVYTTPIEARKGYRNTWFHYRFSSYQDYSENSIMYYMDDSDVENGD